MVNVCRFFKYVCLFEYANIHCIYITCTFVYIFSYGSPLKLWINQTKATAFITIEKKKNMNFNQFKLNIITDILQIFIHFSN